MKYAIVQSGGKQYKVVEGSTLEVDRLNLEVGKKLELKDILLIADGTNVQVGSPIVADAKVGATVLEHFKAPKVIIFKYKAKERYRRKNGHRQMYTRLMVDEVSGKGIAKGTAAKAEKPKVEEPKAEPKKQAAKAAPKTAAKKTPAKKTTKKTTTKKAK